MFAGPPADQSQRPLAGAHQGEMLRVKVEAIIIPEGESAAARRRCWRATEDGFQHRAPRPGPVLIALVGDHPVVGRALLQSQALAFQSA